MSKAIILLGPAGSPAKSTLDGISKIKELGLQAMEVQFSHGVGMSLELAEKIGIENKRYNTSLSIHAPYYINLTSNEKRKIQESKQRILDSCERGHLLGAKNIVFHAAYYGRHTPEETYKLVKKEMLDMMHIIKIKKWNVELAPETTGRISQFGTLDELIKMVKQIRCSICIDPAHIYARQQGKIDYTDMFDKLETMRKKHLHFHFSGIKYRKSGEWYHLNLDKHPDFRPFAKEIIKRGLDVTIISETPITWRDSLKMKKILSGMKYKFD